MRLLVKIYYSIHIEYFVSSFLIANNPENTDQKGVHMALISSNGLPPAYFSFLFLFLLFFSIAFVTVYYPLLVHSFYFTYTIGTSDYYKMTYLASESDDNFKEPTMMSKQRWASEFKLAMIMTVVVRHPSHVERRAKVAGTHVNTDRKFRPSGISALGKPHETLQNKPYNKQNQRDSRRDATQAARRDCAITCQCE
jgi:hypothetical protein